jgi:hypothetical protein
MEGDHLGAKHAEKNNIKMNLSKMARCKLPWTGPHIMIDFSEDYVSFGSITVEKSQRTNDLSPSSNVYN